MSVLDVFSGSNMPLAITFEWCEWPTAVFHRKIQNPSDRARNFDLSQAEGQNELDRLAKSAAFMAVAFDSSTKSRIREILRVIHIAGG